MESGKFFLSWKNLGGEFANLTTLICWNLYCNDTFNRGIYNPMWLKS